MPCFFCDSFFHLSEFCDIYGTDESRKNVIKGKKCCPNCSIKSRRAKDIGHGVGGRKYICGNYKCFICFSKEHSMLFCPNRFYAGQCFPPKIDADLLARFFKMFDLIEQFRFGFFYSSKAKKSYQLIVNPIAVIKDMDFEFIKECKNKKTFVVTNELCLQYIKIPSALFIENIFFRPRKIILNFSKIYANDFFKFFSSSTKELFCTSLELTPEVTFEDLLEKIPNIQHIYFRNTNIEFDDSWPEALLKSNCENLKELEIEIENDEFDVENLAAVMKELELTVKLYIYVNFSYENLLKKNLSNHFDPVKNKNKSESTLKIINYRNKKQVSFDLLEPKK